MKRRGLAASDESPRPLASLAKLLLDGEPVLDAALVKFVDNEVKWLFTVTDRRVAWCIGDQSETRQVPLASIDGVAASGKLRKTKVSFTAGGEPVGLDVLAGASATELAASLDQAIA